MMLFTVLSVLSTIVTVVTGYVVNNGTTCYLYPESLPHLGQAIDDVPSILQAFELCGTNGTVVFTNNTFYINQVMNTTNLLNCQVILDGELYYSDNIPYWLSHSIGVVLQSQSTAWLFGGTNVTFLGRGGWIYGNGQAWYNENKDNSNQPGRPITITFYNSTNLYVDGLTIIQPQFWATFVSHSQNVTMTNVFVNATSDSQYGTVNTDGADTWNSRDIVIENWTVTNGDDCIAAKGNTTNLLVKNVTCYGSDGVTIGSVGQYPLTPDYVENVLFEDIVLFDSNNGAYIKTWQGIEQNTSSNGDAGGGGSGYVKNVTFRNFEFHNVNTPILITQCIYSSGDAMNECDTSLMQISNITWENFVGTSEYNLAASLHCAASHPCPDIYFNNVNITSVNATKGLPLYNTTTQQEVYECANILNENSTSNIPCNLWAPSNFGQSIGMNVDL
jgi:galacturan 1,4-alpha-galacturonidase